MDQMRLGLFFIKQLPTSCFTQDIYLEEVIILSYRNVGRNAEKNKQNKRFSFSHRVLTFFVCVWRIIQIQSPSLSGPVDIRDQSQGARQSRTGGTPRYPTTWCPGPRRPPPPPCSAESAQTRPAAPTWRAKAADSTCSWRKVREMHVCCQKYSAALS